MNTDFFVVDFNSVIFGYCNFISMQKILYLLLIVSIASFGQSDKAKLNSNNDSIYKAVCFTLNDSASIFKFFEFNDYTTDKEYQYKIEGLHCDDKIKSVSLIAVEEAMRESDSNNVKKYFERTFKNVARKDSSVKVIESFTFIGNHYEAYRLEIDLKIGMVNMKANAYILKHDNKFISLAFFMNEDANIDYYLQEFNKLVNTIRFK